MYYVLYNFKVHLFCFGTVKILLLHNKTDSSYFFGIINSILSRVTSQSHFLSVNYLCSFEFLFLLHFTLDEQPTKVHKCAFWYQVRHIGMACNMSGWHD